jgi:TolB protein
MPALRTILLLLFCLSAILPSVSAATVPSWLKFWQGKTAESAVAKAPSLTLADFTGGTGQSARESLVKELTAAREFTLTTIDPDYTLTANSVGGRVTGRLVNRAGKEILDRTYAAPGLDENIKALADDLILAVTGKPGLATSRIVFVSDKTGTKQVYLCDSNGQDLQQVTHHSHGCVSPSLSMDGTSIAYTSYASGFPIVQVLDLGQGWERTVTDTPGSSFGASFAPDGERLAVVMSFLGNPEIFVTDLSANSAACISDSTGAPSSPAWHPDGQQVIFADDRGDGPKLYVTEVPKTNEAEAKLIRWRTGYAFCADPEFSPTADSVAFTTRISGELAVVVKGWPRGSSRVIQKGGACHPSWSPNGQYLCYSQNGTLYVHQLKTGQRRAILSGQGQITEPRWMK